MIAGEGRTHMAFRDELQRKIERKQQEIAELERDSQLQIASARAYLQALQDMLKSLPRDADGARPEHVLRPNSAVARTREAILAAQKPLHINDVLKALGRPTDSANKVSISGSLANYVRKGEIFTRPAPNTFGLIELGHTIATVLPAEPPPNFGSVRPIEEEKEHEVA
jgi:hypothetical protein